MAVETPQKGDETHSSKFAIRYLMAILGSIGLAILYGFKVNMGMAIVTMIKHKNTETGKEEGTFEWDSSTEDFILSAYYIGYFISMMPGARMSELLSAKWVMMVAILLNVIASLLTPVSAYASYMLLILMRIIQGIGGGVSFPAMHVMLSKWAPPSERGVLTSITYSGTSLGMIIGILLTGVIAKFINWEAVFYIEGALCLIWCAAWWILIEDSPEQQKRLITKKEKDFIIKSLEQSDDQHHHHLPVPWGRIAKSMPFYAILVAHMCSNFALYLVLTKLPTFMKKVLHFNVDKNALCTAMASLCMWIFTPLVSKTLSLATDKKLISVTISRKIGTTIASMVPMICLVTLCFFLDNPTVVVALMTIAVGALGAMYSGFLANHIDIGPNFAGTLVALTNCAATIPGIAVSFIVGAITKHLPIDGWKIVFVLTSLLLIVECVFYWIFGTAEEQPWNHAKFTEESTPHEEQTLPLKTRDN